jgi:hypothetical protein
MRTIIIPSEEDDDGKQMSPLSLSQSLDSLLGSKSSLTTEWADSVRSIMNSSCGSPRTTSCSGCTNLSLVSTSSSDGENVHDRQHCLDQEIAKLEGEDTLDHFLFSEITSTLALTWLVLFFLEIAPMLQQEFVSLCSHFYKPRSRSIQCFVLEIGSAMF